MLKKLFKREMKSYSVSFGIVFLCMLVIAILITFVGNIVYGNDDMRSFMAFLCMQSGQYILSAASFACSILVFVRFYSTMTGDRGYLTWTLPATTNQHILSKLLAALLWQVISYVVLGITSGIIFVGNSMIRESLIKEIFAENGIERIMKEIFDVFELPYILPIFLVFTIFIGIIVIGILYRYMCVAIGQLFGKYRLLGTILCYIGVMFLQYIFGIILFILLMVFIDNFEMYRFFDTIGNYWGTNLILFIIVLAEAAVAGIYYLITYKLFQNKLNLE